MNEKNNIQYIQVDKGGTCESMPEYERLKERDRAMRANCRQVHQDDTLDCDWRCPNCNYNFGDEEVKFCPNCGQRIDWTEQEVTNE